ncbi:TniQ family protein [Actinoplanes sp. NBC_00393]
MRSRLPIAVGPAHCETVTSYLSRLATLHAMPLRLLWRQVSQPRNNRTLTRIVVAEQLAEVTGHPIGRLRNALIELRHPQPDWSSMRTEPQRGCPRCTSRHPGGQVLQLLPHHRYVCPHHHIWIGPPDLVTLPLANLDTEPAIVAAQHAHLRLLRRLGPVATHDAVLTAFLVCGHRWMNPPSSTTDVWHHWNHRLHRMIPPGTEVRLFSTSRLFAATYPEVIALAALIGSPYWRRLAAADIRHQRRFTDEIAQRLGDPLYRPRVANDPLAKWIHEDCWRLPSPPASTYETEHDFGGGAPRKVSSAIMKRHASSLAWFTSNRSTGQLGRIMISHRHLGPVIMRGRSPTPQHFVGFLYSSHNTKQFNVHHESEHPTHRRRVVKSAQYIRTEPAPTDYLDTLTNSH